ncbi:MAG: hypothetical protein A2Z14_11100 [Chloroflexi bacterium RBG_16_48_8]|nr:MAG: hypothetical protein A2Z14_11100 [Chloroflexi bacterium RBG_16_48_8]
MRSSYIIIFTLLLTLFAAGIPTQINEFTSGVIGIAIRQNNVGEFILSPVPGQPAGDAGIQEGDALIAIDSVHLQPGMDMPRLLQLLRRPSGTQILLDVRDDEDSIHSYFLTLAGFPLDSCGISTKVYALYLIVIGITLVLGFCIPALIIFFQKSEDWLALFVSLTLVVIAIYNSAAYAGSSILPSPFSETISFVYNLSVLLIRYLFPDGHFVPRWTRQFAVVGVLWILWKILPFSSSTPLWTSNSWIIVDLNFGTGI